MLAQAELFCRVLRGGEIDLVQCNICVCAHVPVCVGVLVVEDGGTTCRKRGVSFCRRGPDGETVAAAAEFLEYSRKRDRQHQLPT